MSEAWTRAVQEAAERRGADIEAVVLGPHGADPAVQAAEIDSLLLMGDADCLVVEAPWSGTSEPAELARVINRATNSGVPVFVVGADIEASQRFAYFGMEDRSAGFAAGSAVGQWAIDAKIWLRVGGVVARNAEDPGARLRMQGFIDGLTVQLPEIQFANRPGSAQSLGSRPGDAYELSRAWILDHPDVDILLVADSGLETVASAIAAEALYGDVSAVGFELSDTVVSYIRDGVVAAALVPDSAAAAAAAAAACTDFLLSGVYETGHVAVDPLAVTEANVDDGVWLQPEPDPR